MKRKLSLFDRLEFEIMEHVKDETAREEIMDLAWKLSEEADEARARAEEAEASIETALAHLDDMTRFGWPDRLQDAYRELSDVM